MDLPYRFALSASPSYREAADPTMVLYGGKYWLFPSKTGGYLWSTDCVNWNLVVPTGLPIENYAPTVLVIGGTMYWTAVGAGIYSTTDPLTGSWQQVSNTGNQGDPDLFQDDDGKIYLYSGLNNGGPIVGQPLDPAFNPLSPLTTFFGSNIANHGGEISAEPYASPPYDTNTSWIEGSWMTKFGGKYYLSYSAPGTQFKSYGDGVYVSSSPLGPFTFAPYSPYSFKPTGFIGGAGHSSTFQDLGGRYWHISTMSISVRGLFERRLGMFPSWFMTDGQAVCNTYLGDYPQYLPGVVTDPSTGNSPGWMLLSYNKPATASSTLSGFPVANAFNEDIRTWWSAATGNPGEWLQVDLGKQCRINAVQINFADQGATQQGPMNDGYGYKLDVSTDGTTWTNVIDHSNTLRNAPHDYTELTAPVQARYARLTNTHSPGGGLFSVSGLRLFGNGLGQPPDRVKNVHVTRNSSDQRQATITWNPVTGADGYMVRYGIGNDRLFGNYQVYGATTLNIHTLNVGANYLFAVDSFNDSGVTPAAPIPDGTYTLTPQCATGSRLDANAGGTVNGTKVQIWQANATAPQSWTFANMGGNVYKIAASYAPGMVLDVSASGSANGTVVQLWQDNGTNAQRWAATAAGGGGYTLTPQCALGSRMDDAASGTANGTQVQIWQANGSAAQAWALTSIGPVGHRVALRANITGDYVSLNPSDADDLEDIGATTPNTWEYFDVRDAGNGSIALLSEQTGKYVTAELGLSSVVLRADAATAINTWETFKWLDIGAGNIALNCAANGLYVSCNLGDSKRLEAGWATTVNAWEQFSWVDLGTH